MKKSRSILAALVLAVAVTGCTNKATPNKQSAPKEQGAVAKTDSKENITNDVKDVITKVQTFKGNAYPENVSSLLQDMKNYVSQDVLRYYVMNEIPETKKGKVTEFSSNEILDCKKISDVDYQGKKYEGYEVTSDLKWADKLSGTPFEFKSVSTVIKVDGKLIVVADNDTPVEAKTSNEQSSSTNQDYTEDGITYSKQVSMEGSDEIVVDENGNIKFKDEKINTMVDKFEKFQGNKKKATYTKSLESIKDIISDDLYNNLKSDSDIKETQVQSYVTNAIMKYNDIKYNGKDYAGYSVGLQSVGDNDFGGSQILTITIINDNGKHTIIHSKFN